MRINNSENTYGVLSVALHWLVAITVVAMFVLGLWMEDLDYYHVWYRKAPDLHRSIGVILIIVVVFRLVWRTVNVQPRPLANHKAWEHRVAKIVHWLLYALLIAMLPTGYFITTAKGQSLDIFDIVSLPAVITGVENLEDVAGEIHEIIAKVIIAIAILHALAALKHHFIDKDKTLVRMFGRS